MAAHPSTKRINLLPPDLRPKIEFQPEMFALGMGAVFVATVTVASTTNHFAIESRQRQLSGIQTENRELAGQISTLTAKKALSEEKQARYTSFQEVLSRKTYWVEMFKELAALMPKDVWLTTLQSSLSDHDRNLILKGEAASQEKVAEFLRALEKSRYFGAIVMKESEKQDDYRPDLYKFEFNIPIAQAPGGAKS